MKFFAVGVQSQISGLNGHSAGLSMIQDIPSSDTFFQYRSWKLTLASVVCRTTSFMSSDLKGVYPQRSI